jgi:hypothetical protein
MLAFQVFNIILPLVFSERDNIETMDTSSLANDTSSLANDTNSSWKVGRAPMASLSFNQMLFKDWSTTKKWFWRASTLVKRLCYADSSFSCTFSA